MSNRLSSTDIITYLIVVVCLVALAFLLYKIIGMANEETPPGAIEETNTVPDTDPSYLDTTQFSNIDFGDEKPLEPAKTDPADSKVMPVDDYPPINTSPASAASSTSRTPAPTSFDQPEAETRTTSSSGAYMVLAGSFKEKINAETMVAKLRKAGFENASVEMFDRGAFAVALVDRFDSYREANALVKSLEKKGIEATIHKKR